MLNAVFFAPLISWLCFDHVLPSAFAVRQRWLVLPQSSGLGQNMGTAREIYCIGSVYGYGPGIYLIGSVYGGGLGNLSHWVSIWDGPGIYLTGSE